MNSLNIVFAGTPAFALPCLEALIASNHRIRAVYTQPDRPSGRGRTLQPSPVKALALQHELPVNQPVNFKNQAAIDELAALEPDVIVVIAYGLILPEAVLAIPRLGCVNVHASLLPRWRGASPIQHAILYGDDQSGVTIMQMDKGMDTGAMLSIAPCTIDAGETAKTLHDKLENLAVKPLLSTLEKLANGEVDPVSQDDNQATYAPKIKKEDAKIDWHQPAEIIDRKIRAFNPWPITYTYVNDTLLRIHQAQLITEPHQHTPGTIIRLDKKGLLVAAGKNSILIEHLQFPGGKIMTVADWLNAGRSDLQTSMILK